MSLAHHFFVCNNQKAETGKAVAKALKAELKSQGLKHHTRVQTCSCLDLCKHCKKGPGAALVIYPEGIFYGDVRPQDVPELVHEHVGKGRVVKRLRIEY